MYSWMKKYGCYVFIGVSFYLVPFLMRDTGAAVFLLLFFFPFLVVTFSLLHVNWSGFSWGFPCAVALFWIPAVYLHYNDSALIYTILYGGISFAAEALGYVSWGKRKRNHRDL